jgi:hypothetical protein
MGGSVVGGRPIYFNHKLIGPSNVRGSIQRTRRQGAPGRLNKGANMRLNWQSLEKLYAATFFSDGAMTRVDGPTNNTLGFK